MKQWEATRRNNPFERALGFDLQSRIGNLRIYHRDRPMDTRYNRRVDNSEKYSVPYGGRHIPSGRRYGIWNDNRALGALVLLGSIDFYRRERA